MVTYRLKIPQRDNLPLAELKKQVLVGAKLEEEL